MGIDLSRDLNDKQKEACELLEGPVLILAGAGAGKTRVLTYKIAHMIENGVAPENIIALTFTNKAAKEMKERVNSFFTYNHYIWISTFHSACSRILRKHIDKIGFDLNFTIYDDSDSLTLIKQIMKAHSISDKIIKPKTIKTWIGEAKNNNIKPKDFVAEQYGYLGEKAAKVYKIYQESLKKNNAVDFGDILMLVLEIFETSPEVLREYQERLKYVLVDEYQDTNKVQYLFLRYISALHGNITVVGDEDQSIYGWRGADINNILDFNKHYDGVRTVKLEENYRSTQTILSAANDLVKHNKSRLGKTIWTSNGEGDKIALHEAASDRKEADWVVDKIDKFHTEDSVPLSEIAVFYRTNAQSRLFEERLRRANIPYRIYGGLKFYDRAEIKNVIAYFKLLVNPTDDIALKRVLGLTAGIGKTTIDSVIEEAGHKGVPLFELIASGEMVSIKNAGKTKLKKFYDLITKLKSTSEQDSISDLYDLLTRETQIISSLEKQKTIEAQSKLENLEEFKASLKEFEGTHDVPTLFNYLDEVSLLTTMDEDKEDVDASQNEKLTLMTLHMSKGLEYDYVFVVGLEEKLLPHSRVEFDPNEVEEERRLLYVGMTRARKNLHLSHAKMRDVYGQSNYSIASRFLDEVKDKYVNQVVTQTPNMVFTRNSFNGFSTYKRETPRQTSQKSFSGEPRVVYDDPREGIKQGSMVSHKIFGVGKIMRVEGHGDNAKLTIQFKSGLKKLKGAYASLELL